ncbi:MAG: DUF1028 domain-containing protein [Phaeodactylibacter sp.]|nr:DUF1028 domain-containing protein [Phaeodactylibacter sp.]
MILYNRLMKKWAPLFIVFCSVLFLQAQDTFSIVAVDPETGEVGSAGASCVQGAGAIGGVILLNGIIPGRGGVNAQAFICVNPHINLDNAMARMGEGFSPQEIIDWLIENDECFSQNFDPSYRQYGIADFDPDGNPRTAAHTGSNADNWKGHITGANYSIQGNILRGPEVIDSMEARFLATQGSLAKKLMAAMQGANIVGADSRCTAAGTSSTSAFLRVFRPDDEPDAPYLELNVAETPTGVEPIDSLQSLFDEWVMTGTGHQQAGNRWFQVYPNPSRGRARLFTRDPQRAAGSIVRIYALQGQLLQEEPFEGQSMEILLPAKGILLLQVSARTGQVLHTQSVVYTE